MYININVYLQIYIYIYLYTYLYIFYIYKYYHIFKIMHTYMFAFFNWNVYLSICFAIYLSIYLFIYLFIYLSNLSKYMIDKSISWHIYLNAKHVTNLCNPFVGLVRCVSFVSNTIRFSPSLTDCRCWNFPTHRAPKANVQSMYFHIIAIPW